MNIKVAAFTVSEKSSNTVKHVHLAGILLGAIGGIIKSHQNMRPRIFLLAVFEWSFYTGFTVPHFGGRVPIQSIADANQRTGLCKPNLQYQHR